MPHVHHGVAQCDAGATAVYGAVWCTHSTISYIALVLMPSPRHSFLRDMYTALLPSQSLSLHSPTITDTLSPFNSALKLHSKCM